MVEQVLNLNKEKTIFWSITSAIFMLMGMYIYYINLTVHNVVARQNLENEASSLTLLIGNKEFEYISKRNQVNLALAYSMGFTEVKSKSYISMKTQNNVAVLPR